MNDTLMVIGEALIDFIPTEQGMALKDVCSFTKHCGGAPINIAAATAKLGAHSKVLTQVGADAFGDFILETLSLCQVDITAVKRTKQYPTALAFVALDEKGNRDFTFYRDNFIYMPCTEENGFMPDLPKETPDVIYLCFPNNPTGMCATKAQLKKWVDYALANDALIIFDSAYEAFIVEDDVPHSIYEIEGAEKCAIELRSFSKTAGFTGVRCGYTVVPKACVFEGKSLNPMWARRQATKFNGVSYITQRAAEAVYTEQGQKEIKETLAYYQKNAQVIFEGMQAAGFTCYGAVNSPYVWLKVPEGMTSWEFFDLLLDKTHVVGTPGSGFGPSGEGFFRLTAFGNADKTVEAVERIKAYFAQNK